jgi:hypothetical protein
MSQQQDYAGYAWHASDQTVWETTKADRGFVRKASSMIEKMAECYSLLWAIFKPTVDGEVGDVRRDRSI